MSSRALSIEPFPRQSRRRSRNATILETLPAATTADTSATIELRMLTAQDSHHILRLFETLSTTDRYFRFLSATPRLTTSTLRRLLAMNGTDHVALGAFDGALCVGIGRYVRLQAGHSDAELSVAVDPAQRNRGIATRLTEELAQIGARNGVTRFTALVHPKNFAALNGARARGFDVTYIDDSYLAFMDVDKLT